MPSEAASASETVMLGAVAAMADVAFRVNAALLVPAGAVAGWLMG